MRTQLQPGTLLDDRFRIDAVLGQGGFGITYAAEHTRLGMRVAVKELFWRGHSVRIEGASPEVALENPDDTPVFEEQKQRFLREARIIRDFSGQTGVVGIMDYFEANGTAYIVMEYVEGETLASSAAAKTLSCVDLLRRFLPIIETLAAIHRAGIIHRDISPENVMVQPDGSLKLIDFGAARQYRNEENHSTAISRDSYSPGEQYDRNGRQGPWTDVYALCATIYACVCGAPPPGAVQRLLLDELKTPSEMGIDIRPAYENILMTGLQLRPEKRWQDMDALAKAIREALPPEKPPWKDGLLIGLLAGLLLAALALGIWGWHRYNITHKFQGIETELIRFEATEDTTAAEFAAAPDELRNRLERFVGRDNYLLDVDGAHIDLTLPLSAFEGMDIDEVISEHFSKLVPEKGTHISYEFKANWEDPAHSTIAGRNQVLPESLEGPTVICWYGCDSALSAGQRANLIVDFKTRLDALEAPYAFGTIYGNSNAYAFRISTTYIGPPILGSIAESHPLTIDGLPWGNWDILSATSNNQFERIEESDGASGFRYVACSEYARQSLQDYTQAMLDAGLDRFYLSDQAGNNFASASLSRAVTDGTVEFRDFCLEGIPHIQDDSKWLMNYLDVLVNQTNLPASCVLRGQQYIDAEGRPRLDVIPEYGIRSVPLSETSALRERIAQVCHEHGYTFTENNGFIRIMAELPLDEALPGSIADRLPAILEALHINHAALPQRIVIGMAKSQNGVSPCQFDIYTTFARENKQFRTVCDCWLIGNAITPWSHAISDWYESYDWDAAGLEKN